MLPVNLLFSFFLPFPPTRGMVLNQNKTGKFPTSRKKVPRTSFSDLTVAWAAPEFHRTSFHRSFDQVRKHQAFAFDANTSKTNDFIICRTLIPVGRTELRTELKRRNLSWLTAGENFKLGKGILHNVYTMVLVKTLPDIFQKTIFTRCLLANCFLIDISFFYYPYFPSDHIHK